jgi:hypothetical protein
MHTESPALSDTETTLPPELALSTQTILSGLPSSSYFTLLPAGIRSYKPYVELSSASSSVPGHFLEDKLRNWFDQTCSILQDSLDRWLLELNNVKSVWNVRSSLRKWLLTSGLVKTEQTALDTLFEEAARKRVTAIWTDTIHETKELFLKALASLTSSSGVVTEGMYLGALCKDMIQKDRSIIRFFSSKQHICAPICSIPAPNRKWAFSVRTPIPDV